LSVLDGSMTRQMTLFAWTKQPDPWIDYEITHGLRWWEYSIHIGMFVLEPITGFYIEADGTIYDYVEDW
jgi:hypothetical protein